MGRIIVEEPRVNVSITRFDVQQRAQHILIITSFFVLSITGIPLKFSDWQASALWMAIWHGPENVRIAHHWAAWVMIATCAYHLIYSLTRRPFSTEMFPKPRDIVDFIDDMKHTFRLSKKHPQFGRYSYRNKMAYWVVYPGAVTMIVTGLILLFPIGATAHLPGWSVPLSLMIHSDASILAIGWILFVHMYYAHFSRLTMPFDKSVITGKVPIERYAEEFPREYAMIVAAERPTLRLPKDVSVPGLHPHGASHGVEEPALEEPVGED